MATGPEHYVAAEAEIAAALDSVQSAVLPHLAAAQVHATLSLAAATALGATLSLTPRDGMPTPEYDAWDLVAGEKPWG